MDRFLVLQLAVIGIGIAQIINAGVVIWMMKRVVGRETAEVFTTDEPSHSPTQTTAGAA